MAIGQKMGSLKNLKSSMAKGGGGNAWIKFIPKNGSMNVRFIQEPEEWVNYSEHFDTVLRKSFPCNGETSCPGCKSDSRKSSRYLTNALDVDNDRVIPLQLPKELANRLVAKYEKYGSMTDRDYELSRSGEGLDTVYDLEVGPVDRKKIDKYQPLDLLKVLDDAFNDVFGSITEQDPWASTGNGNTPVPAVRGRKKTAAAKVATPPTPQVEDEPEVDDSGDDVAVDEPEFTPDVDLDSEQEHAALEGKDGPLDTDASTDDDEGETWDEESLRALPLGALRAVAGEFGVSARGKTQEQIITEILSAGEPVDDDEPGF